MITSETAEELEDCAQNAASRGEHKKAYTLAITGLGLMIHKANILSSADENYQCCGYPMSRVINAQEQVCKGFFCEHCRHFETSIGREKQLPPDTRKEDTHAS